jgi:hypothetical protein
VVQELLIHEVSRSQTTTHHSQYESSGRVISLSQRPLPDNTQHTTDKTPMPPVGFESTITAGEQPQTSALDRAATGAGILLLCKKIIQKPSCSCHDLIGLALTDFWDIMSCRPVNSYRRHGWVWYLHLQGHNTMGQLGFFEKSGLFVNRHSLMPNNI